nr:MAG TPA: hypothetical protein [Bacteriophage sp.]
MPLSHLASKVLSHNFIYLLSRSRLDGQGGSGYLLTK